MQILLYVYKFTFQCIFPCLHLLAHYHLQEGKKKKKEEETEGRRKEGKFAIICFK